MEKRKRKAEIREDLQPVPDLTEVEEQSSRFGFPSVVHGTGAALLYFHGTATITGDGLYRGFNHKGELKHAIVTNPEAASRQSEYLARHGRR